MFLIDSHCHLNLLNYDSLHKNVADVLNKASKKGIKLVLSVSTSILDYNNMIQCVGKRNDVIFSCGVHPIYLNNTIKEFDRSELYDLSTSKQVVAIGETGLDYYKLNNKTQQQRAFMDHIDIAKKINKPVIVHSRNASKDIIRILKSAGGMQCGGILHCFSEDVDFARHLLDLNFYISFSGMVTFRHSYKLNEAIKYVPMNNILLETDAPYLTPEPYRGHENQPAYIYEIAQYIATIKNVSLNQLAYYTTINFNTLFKLNNNNVILDN